MKYCYYNSPVGRLLIAAENDALVGLWIENQKYYAKNLEHEAKEDNNDPVLKSAKAWLDKYFAGEKPKISNLKLKPEGSEFQRSVWKILEKIPYGKTATYGAIAQEIAKERGLEKMSARAVGTAIGQNPITIIIPCHRVLGINSKLTGYSAGIDKKTKLLELEKAEFKR